MKKILIAILLVIILIFAYNQYKEHQRFNPPNSNYKVSETVDLDYHNPSIVYNYNEAVATLNGFVTMQWSANEIDVKSPENDDEETQYAVNEYSKKLAKVKFHEGKLEQSQTLKSKGFTNADIINFESKGVSVDAYNALLKSENYRKMMLSNLPKNNLRSGQKSLFIYEIQKLLVKKGYDIPVDGVFKTITSNAIMEFEAKNNFFVDGNIDEMTLNLLLE